MTTQASLEKRISNLENSGESEDRLIIFFIIEEGDKKNAEYIHDCCEKCCDKETLENVLGSVVLSQTGVNPWQQHAIRFVHITKKIMCEVVQRLKDTQGIEVSL